MLFYFQPATYGLWDWPDRAKAGLSHSQLAADMVAICGNEDSTSVKQAPSPDRAPWSRLRAWAPTPDALECQLSAHGQGPASRAAHPKRWFHSWSSYFSSWLCLTVNVSPLQRATEVILQTSSTFKPLKAKHKIKMTIPVWILIYIYIYIYICMYWSEMAITKWSQGTLSFRQKHRPTYPPILQSPVPPFQALTYFGLAYRDTGLKLPVEK